MKKVLVIGSGGREHSLAWKLTQSSQVEKVFVAPGNGGSDGEKIQNVSIAISEHDKVIAFAKENDISLVVVAPDDALAAGLVDVCKENGLVAFGPTQKAAQIESSKAFSKELMKKYNIKTAAFETFTDYEEASHYVQTATLPIVVKASGLALGKGVYICQTKEEAQQALDEMMLDQKFGDSGSEIVIEQFLDGIELSTHVFCDGKKVVMFPPSQDHKTIGEGNTGPNTGGMGTIAPLPWVTSEMKNRAQEEVAQKTIDALQSEGISYEGVLYPGLMKMDDEFYVLEFNARFGDPETQSYMRILDTDLYEILVACAQGKLSEIDVQWSEKFVACVVLASGGYPESYEKGFEITGIEDAESDPDVVVFHAGTKRDGDKIVTNGGRVLNVTATAGTLEQALEKAYSAADKISFEGKYMRRDIGKGTLDLM